MNAAGLQAAAEVLLRYDYHANRASSHEWDSLSTESQQLYLLRARQVIEAYEGAGDGVD